MRDFNRYAIYYAPQDGALAEFAARWLGWDPAAGKRLERPVFAGLPRPVGELTATPRKYGFHATIKPPFRLAANSSRARLEADMAGLADRLAPARSKALHLARLGRFLALVPEGDARTITALAAETVAVLDHHRALPTESELVRRRAAGLSSRQEALLKQWGYPYVMDEFRFHMTLTGRLHPGEADAVEAVLAPLLAPLLPAPFVIGDLCLFGEDETGMFHQLERFTLSG